MDILILRFIHLEMSNVIWDSLCPILRTKTTWIPLYMFFGYYFWKHFPKDYWKIILTTIVLVSLTDILCAQVLKPWGNRLRPCQVKDLASWLHLFPNCSQTFSFPSCHAMNHAALAFFISPFFKKWPRAFLLIWVTIIGYSQLYIGVHYPSDVLAGILLGGILAFLTSIIFKRWILRDNLPY